MVTTRSGKVLSNEQEVNEGPSFSDISKKQTVIISMIDNLVKGAAGQAIQNMNLMFGFNESESLM